MASVESHRGHRNGHERHALRSRADDVISDFAELRRDVSRLAEAATKAARSEMASAGQRLHDVQQTAMERAKSGAAFVGAKVRERPAAALGITLGAGLILGMLISASRRH